MDFFMEVKYNMLSELLEFDVDMPNNTWLSIGFGKNMDNVDMIAWFANGDNSSIGDYFSVGIYRPPTDPQ